MPKKRQTKLKGKTTTKTPSTVISTLPESAIKSSNSPTERLQIANLVHPIIKDWVDVYTSHIDIHSKIANVLNAAGYISLESSGTSFPDITFNATTDTNISSSLLDDVGALLKQLQNQTNDSVDISTRSGTPPTKATASMQTSPARSPDLGEAPLVDAQLVDESRLLDQTILGVPKRILCKLNNENDLTLEFSNRGNNSALDIQTYLQEKLDVLDFLQQDHSSTSRREKHETSRLHLPRRRPSQGQTVSVSDWLNDTAASTTSVPSGGFFIGTPAPSVAAVDDDDRQIHEVEAALLNDSEIRWETDSMISSASSPMRRGRDRSGSLFSHYRGRDRVSRLAANSLDFGDEDSEVENSFLENTSVLGKSGGFGFGTGRWF
jgi:hypothetical protein